MSLIDEILFISERECSICKENESKSFGICEDCLERLDIINELYFNSELEIEVNSILFYNRFAKSIIRRFKFLSEPYLYNSLGELMFFYADKNNFLRNIDLIMPVPLHKDRKKARGYNQSELLAKKISELSGIKICIDAAVKVKNTPEQNKLNYERRKRNLKNSIKIIDKNIVGKDILIIDDFITTGETIKSLYNPLKDMGIKSAKALVLSSGKTYY
ncbi:MAG: ComF family protein [Tissierellia bacterium]|nr:ComF family protein [Tissierellia bacterium]